MKETIMKAVLNKTTVEFEGAQISLFPDLSHRTLMQRRAVRPLLKALCAVDVKYCWGFPFSLTDTRNGKTADLRT